MACSSIREPLIVSHFGTIRAMLQANNTMHLLGIITISPCYVYACLNACSFFPVRHVNAFLASTTMFLLRPGRLNLFYECCYDINFCSPTCWETE